MKKTLWLGIIAFFALCSCQKEDSQDEVNNPVNVSDYFPMSIGNYWVYNHYQIDSSGNEKLILENDTMEIVGDTLINGNSYFKFYGRPYSGSYKRYSFLRDSSGYIVGEDGSKTFSQTNFGERISEEILMQGTDTLYEKYLVMEETDISISVPAGSFDKLINRKLVFIGKKLQMPINPRIMNSYYAENIGRVTYEYAYASQNGSYIKRLIEYNVDK